MPQGKRFASGLLAAGLAAVLCGAQGVRAGQDAASPELILQSGHAGKINAIAFSPDGATIATGSADGTVKLWEAKTGRLRRTLGGYEDEVHTVFFSRDGGTLVSQSSITPECSTGDGCVNVIRFHDAHDFTLKRKREVGGFKGCTAVVSSDLRTIVRADDEAREVLDAGTMKRKALLQAEEPIVFAPDGKTAAFKDGVIFDARTWRPGRRIEAVSTPLAFSPDGQRLLGAGLVMADVRSGAVLWRADDTSSEDPSAPAFSADGETVLFARDETVKMLDSATGRLRRTIKSPDAKIAAVAFSPDGQTFATGDTAGNLRLWDVRSATSRWFVSRNEARVLGLRLLPEQATLLIARADRWLTLWNLRSGEIAHQRIPFAGPWTGWEISQDGRTLAVHTEETVVLWDLRTGSHLRTLKPGAGLFRLSPDLLLIAVGEGNGVRILDTRTGKLKFSLTGHRGGSARDGVFLRQSDPGYDERGSDRETVGYAHGDNEKNAGGWRCPAFPQVFG